MQPTIVAMAPIAALGGAILASYSSFRKAVLALLGCSVITAHYSGALTASGIVTLAILAVVLFMMQKVRGLPGKERGHLIYFIGAIILCALIVTHVLPGFHAISFAQDVLLSPQSKTFDINLGYGKALVATLLLIYLLNEDPIANRWRKILPTILVVTTATTIIIMPLGILFGIIAYEPKLMPIFFAWALVNLFSAIIIEEVFFRGILQKKLTNFMTGKIPYSWIWSVLIIAWFFALVHMVGGVLYMALVFIAGCGYGIAYKVAGIEAAIGTHLMVNATHFVLFTYPALATYQP